MSGKGDTRRPGDAATYRTEYDRIFGRRSAPAVPPRCADQLDDATVRRIMAELYNINGDGEMAP